VSQLQIGRLAIGPALQWYEQLSDPVQTNGGAVVPNTRTAPQYQLVIGTIAPDGQTDTPTARLVLRRQLRSMLNNAPLKLQAFLYVIYSDDLEQDGWYVPDQASLQDFSGSSGLATGFWQLSSNWYLVGHQRTHREARQIWMKNLTTGLYPRDTLGWVYSTEFSGLTPLAWSCLPNGATAAIVNVSAGAVELTALEAGSDGGVSQFATGLSDLQVVSYERPEAALNLGDVIVYDRNGDTTAPATGVQADWNEVYGPDWPWSNQSTDVPQIQNGLCRVRYDPGNTPGFRVDAWSGGQWIEQGKVFFERDDKSEGGAGLNPLTTLVSSGLMEWTPDRAVIQAVMTASADPLSHERVLITLQRGWTGPRFELYDAPGTDGTTTNVTGETRYAVALADTNDSIAILTSINASGVISSSALPTPGTLPSATLGFAGESWAHVLRQGASLAAVLALVQAEMSISGISSSSAYGTSRNTVTANALSTTSGGYMSAQLGYYVEEAQQVLECESMTLGSGTSSTSDSTASATHAATATRTTDANAHVTEATWPNGYGATYRLFLRVRVSAGTGTFYATTGVTTGSDVTTTSTSYVWLDCGDMVANDTTLSIHAWISTGSGTVYVDRLEAVKLTDAVTFDGARDQGARALFDSRTLGSVVSR
jgi:hypothetical protein